MAQLNDIYNDFGNDIIVSPTGDLQRIDGLTKGQQRVLRRLLTNPQEVRPDGSVLPADYLWHPEYGAGIARFIGQPGRLRELEARIRSQMLLESCVARIPAPTVTVTGIADGVSCSIRYTDADSKEQAILSFNVTQ